MDDYLSKPVTTETLDAMLVRWLGPVAPAVVAPPPSAAGSVIDTKLLAELQGSGMDGLLAELIGLFSEDAPLNLERIRAALSGGDAAELARVAHALKGSAATLGARAMAATCLELETGGHAGRTAELGPALARLEQQTDEVLRGLAAVAAGLATGAALKVGAAGADEETEGVEEREGQCPPRS
jgi:HPt (histidine-containing phosphotransfer) domain-containing protein